MPRVPADALLQMLLDPGSWEPWPTAPAPPDALADPQYRQELAAAGNQSGESESVVVGLGRIADQQVVIVASVFDFLAGSVGQSSAAMIIAAFDRAADLGLPVIGLPTSGGTRMQEGTPAFLQMINIASAVRRHGRLGLPYLVWLRHPTTGGVFATWGSLGDITFGQPEALTGFLGPRVYEGLYGEPFPSGVQTSEGLARSGVIDAVLPAEQLRDTVATCLRIWQARKKSPMEPAKTPDAPAVPPQFGAWEAVLATRSDGRLGVTALLAQADATVLLSGTQAGEVASSTVLVLVLVGDTGCVLVGQNGPAQRRGARIGPADLRVARRGMALAAKWGLPFVSVIDTQGGELSAAAESGAMAGEIARCLADLSELSVPSVALMLGGGAGGAALALLAADHVIAVADAWITPLPPEGAALIRHRDAGLAAQMAGEQRITAPDLAAVGAVDVVLPALQGPLALAQIYAALSATLASLPRPAPGVDSLPKVVREQREERWRRLTS